MGYRQDGIGGDNAAPPF